MIDADRPVIEFTADDRCDRCGAQAMVLAQNSATGGEFLFCGHHIRENQTALRAAGYELTVDGYQAEQAGYTEAVLV
jgi:hypothetical protein